MEHDVGDGTPAFEPILRTKLHRPQLTAELVRRDRLIAVMNRAHQVPLTLVSAPAGYGKSVLVAQWAEELDSPIAWLSLDAGESELRGFLRYFVAAVETASPGACDASRELLTAGTLAPVPVLAGYLLNDLDAIDAPGAIVLDDYHRIEPLSPVHDLMLRMLEHPPRQFRFVVLTRQDPPFDLPGLRAGHRIHEVGLRDLRFTGQETSEFLSATTDLSVSDEALTHVEREVEGWAVGLRLVSLALRHVGDPDAFLRGLPEQLPEIQDYLLREVLAAQAPGIRERMLASSILDRFCAEVLDAVCETPDSDDPIGLTAAGFLEELRASNLFTISLDARGRWFRYHHLLQELLASELKDDRGPDRVAALHLRASEWFEGAGLIDEAIQHALAAEDMERAAELVVRHRHAALDAYQWFVLESWLSLIPETVVQRYAELLLARVWILLNHHLRPELVPALLDRVESLLREDPGEEELRGEVALCRGYVLWLMGHGAESLKLMEEALKKIPVAHLEVRSNAEIILAVSNQMVGRREQAIRFLDDQLADCDPAQGERRARLLFARVFIHVLEGELPVAVLTQRRLREVVDDGGSAYTRAWTDYMQGVLHLNRCEWGAAAEVLGRSVAQRFIHHSRAAVDSIIGLMLAHQALGREEEAREAMQILQDYVASRDDPALDVLVTSAEARFAILQGRPEPARRWLAVSDPPAEGFHLFWTDIPSITRCRAMIAVGPPAGLAPAEAKLLECATVIEQGHNAFQLVKVLALLALACEQQGKTEEALEVLGRAVTLARKGGVVLPFVELGTPMVDLLGQLTGEREFTTEVERLVAAFGAPADRPAARQSRAGEPPAQAPAGRRAVAGRNPDGLTHRELDVLELLALRLQNKEIAARLGISSQTVNSHLKQIYRKLDAHGRRQAAERAVASGILDRHPPG